MMLILVGILVILNLALTVWLLLRQLRIESASSGIEKLERTLRQEMATNRDEVSKALKNFGDSSSQQIIGLTKVNEQKLDNVRASVEERLKSLQEDNSRKLDEIRLTVDEKLHTTLERRLGESFKLVSDRLEQVHKGLGDMQTLATGVGDLKKVLGNVKVRGILGEFLLQNLLDEVLTPDQYVKNIPTKSGTRDSVEFAIKFPGRDDKTVYLPIDSKFPQEDYRRLTAAQEQANPALVDECRKALENRIKSEAKTIHDKYLDPPHTTEYGILFLPEEGLYAEVLRIPGLFDHVRHTYKVVINGPTTILAFLNSLHMGFRTIAIAKRSGEVWNLLSVVKTEFGKFGEMLERTNKQLQAASNTIEDAARKSRTIEKKLKDVQVLPSPETRGLLMDTDGSSLFDHNQ